jgi:Ubiquitin family
MHVYIRTLSTPKTPLIIDAELSDSVHDLKLLIQLVDGTPIETMRLVFCDLELSDDDMTLRDVGITHGSTVYKAYRLSPVPFVELSKR